jgi:deoxyxylulose-5-phosphate synthase
LILRSHRHNVVLEEHVPHNGLSSKVKEIAWDIRSKIQIHAFKLKDEFIHSYGEYLDLLASYGLGANTIVAEDEGFILSILGNSPLLR